MASLWVAVGGATGAWCRYMVGKWIAERLSEPLPVATAAVNLLGAFLFGCLWALLEARPHEGLKLLLLSGFLGAFTTFSTFAFESVRLVEQGRGAVALVSLLGQNILGTLLVYCGLRLGEWFAS